MQVAAPHVSGVDREEAERLTPPGGPEMNAITHSIYGPPELLTLRRVPVPALRPDSVLIRVHAVGLHAGDCFAVRGVPLPVRAVSGFFRPKPGIPGFDLSGQVAAVGSRVTRFRPGDAVFGASQGTCAEFATAREDHLVFKPSNLTFEQAAGVATSGLAALHGLRDAGGLKPGDRCLINGASGGIGTFAIQIAKALGAEVTAVCSTANVALVRELGADRVIDYTRDDFTAAEGSYDVILDNVENRTLAECRRALAPDGTLVLNSGTGARGIRFLIRLLAPIALSPFVGQNLRRYMSEPNAADLAELKNLIEAGKVTPVIDRTFPLAETAAALRYIETCHARGKVVIKIPSVPTWVRPFGTA